LVFGLFNPGSSFPTPKKRGSAYGKDLHTVDRAFSFIILPEGFLQGVMGLVLESDTILKVTKAIVSTKGVKKWVIGLRMII
jgi:hypothetical protein